MEIQKYKARISISQWVIGYPIEVREESGEGTYNGGTTVLIAVTEKSMPGGAYGTYRVEADSLQPWPVKVEAKRKIEEKSIRQLFQNRSNCYAVKDAPNILGFGCDHSIETVQAMDEDCFTETVEYMLSKLNVLVR